MTMPDRIEVNVIGMARVIPGIAQRVFPVATLPDSAFALVRTTRRQRFAADLFMRERRLDEASACGEIGIVLRQCPDGVEMIGQHHNRLDHERMTDPCLAECAPQ